MDSDLYRRAEEIFHAVQALAPKARAGFLIDACGDDADLRREVESLLGVAADPHSFLDRPALADASLGPFATPDEETADLQLPCSIGPYRLVREIGRGGMGTVYEAEQEGLGRQVAIKLLRPAMATGTFLSRFRAEQRILAGLEHPGIGRLYSAGTTDQGLPYLVMEYVHGTTLLTHCNARELSLSERLRLFVRVCEATRYAHQHLVVHRDLKPSNILVTQDGNPKLLDFGIAKLLHPTLDAVDVGATVTGQRLMTPEYASPEQVRAEPVTMASDVYSLGVVLYELLTGRRPYRDGAALHELERSVLEDIPEKPSTAVMRSSRESPNSDASISPAVLRKRARALRGDLDNIVLKALAKNPADRYATADELAEDLRRHVAGLPVRARPASAGYQARKFVERHRLGVAATASVLMALIGGLGAAVWQARIASSSAVEADRQRGVAERRFRDVRALANTFLFEFHDAIADVVGTTPARELVLRRGVEFLDRLAAEAGDDPELRDELARSYLRLATLHGATFYNPRVLSSTGPQHMLTRAVELAEMNHRAGPHEVRFALTLSSAYRALGRFQQKQWQPEARVPLQRSLEIVERAFAEQQTNVDLRDSLIDAHLAWGLYLHMHAPLSRAEAHYRAALRLAIEPQHGWQQLARAAVAEEETAGWLAWVLAHQERWNEALEMYSRQRAVAIQSLEAAPDSADASRSVALGEHNVGYALLGLGRASEALERLDAALERLERLARADSDNSLAKTDVGRTLQIRADALEALGRHEEGLMATRRSLEIHEAQFQAEPENGAIRARVAWDLRRTAELWLAARRQPAAVLGHLQRAKQLSEKNLTLDPTGTFDRLNRARCLSTLAVLEAESSGTPRTDLAQASHSTQRSEYRSQALAAWQEIANDGLLPPSERGRLESLSSSR